MNIGKAIRLCRTQRELNQSQLAERAGISVSYLSLLERGKRDPSFSTVENISTALDVPITILVFIAADEEELSGITPELRGDISYTALRLIEGSNGELTVSKKTNRER